RFGTSTDVKRPGNVFANVTSSAVSASCGKRRGGTNEPTSISRWPAVHASRIHSIFCAVGSTRTMLCRPSRRPTSRMTTGGRELMFLAAPFRSDAHEFLALVRVDDVRMERFVH